MPGVGPGYCVALPVNGERGRERSGNTGKAHAGSWQMASQQWLGTFPRAEVTVKERSNMQAVLSRGCVASPWLRASSLLNHVPRRALRRLVGVCSHFPAGWLAMSGPTWFRFSENPLFVFGRPCFQSPSALRNELLSSGQPD